MAALWELICHHTYRGIPGVVVDLSPSGASHGQVFGLDDGDFLADGLATGSGAVRFYKQDGRIRVPTEATPWQSVVGVKGEVTLRRQPSIGFIIDSDAFQFHIRGNTLDMPVAWFGGYPNQNAEISTVFDSVGPQPYRIPSGPWVTLGFMHDGFGTMELYADGEVVARRTGVYAPVKSPGGAGLSIGNALSSGGLSCSGEIDDVKIWRLNPRRIDDEFYSRPMDRQTAECWKRFRQQIEDAFQRHPDCAKQIGRLVQEAVDSFIRQANAQGPETQSRLLRAAKEYNRLWREGKIDSPEMADVFIDLIGWLRIAGIAPDDNAALASLKNSACWQLILGELTPLDCDRQFMTLLRVVTDNLGDGRRTKVTTA
ncbi:LamG-like jellyroll fold domain-containing protein [Methyloceanibacter sp.]|uniref:LamG-like jellyroll fold domain-containing protein n=1 Tax=Methyloceanibacter sp. TaxID=1965321 RepID=UPI003D6D7A19